MPRRRNDAEQKTTPRRRNQEDETKDDTKAKRGREEDARERRSKRRRERRSAGREEEERSEGKPSREGLPLYTGQGAWLDRRGQMNRAPGERGAPYKESSSAGRVCAAVGRVRVSVCVCVGVCVPARKSGTGRVEDGSSVGRRARGGGGDGCIPLSGRTAITVAPRRAAMTKCQRCVFLVCAAGCWLWGIGWGPSSLPQFAWTAQWRDEGQERGGGRRGGGRTRGLRACTNGRGRQREGVRSGRCLVVVDGSSGPGRVRERARERERARARTHAPTRRIPASSFRRSEAPPHGGGNRTNRGRAS